MPAPGILLLDMRERQDRLERRISSSNAKTRTAARGPLLYSNRGPVRLLYLQPLLLDANSKCVHFALRNSNLPSLCPRRMCWLCRHAY